MTIQDFLKYIRYELNYSAHTVLSYKTDLDHFIDYLTRNGLTGHAAAVSSRDEAEQLLPQVSQRDIRAWMLERAAAGDSPRTTRRRVQAVRALYHCMASRGEVEENPAADVEMARVRKKLPSYMRQDRMDKLMDEQVDETDFIAVRDHLMVMTLYETGMRRAELIGMLDADVDTNACQLKVHGKRDKDRIIPFTAEMRHWIGLYRELRREQATPTCGQFFVRPCGGPLYPSLVYNVVHRALMQAGGGNKYSPHVLRHTFASVMLNGGAQLTSVKSLLGHQSLAATQVYTHITFSELKHNYKLAHPRATKKGG